MGCKKMLIKLILIGAVVILFYYVAIEGAI